MTRSMLTNDKTIEVELNSLKSALTYQSEREKNCLCYYLQH